MKKIAVIGKFDTKQGIADGQAVKTNIFSEELECVFGTENVTRINTYGWKKHPLQLAIECFFAVRKHDNVIFMTDEGGIKIFPWMLQGANIFGKSRVHYVVVGGWLPESLKTRKLRTWLLSRLDGIYVETATMKRALEARGLNNVSIVRNCKRLSILPEDELIMTSGEPYKLCTFSRVMREKGIQDAVEAVCTINCQAGRNVYMLDIYGQIDPEQIDWFEQLKNTFPEYIRYCGVVPYQESVKILKGYDLLLFPTKFYTEGIPGTIIDAYAAGVPIISSQWESFSDVLDDETCLSYTFDDQNGLLNVLKDVMLEPSVIFNKKSACLEHAKLYTTETVIATLISKLQG